MGNACNCKETKYGYFICPICKKKSGYDKWQKIDDKWIFHRDNAWYASDNGNGYDFPEDCWKNTGGATSEKWNKIDWVCLICKYPSNTFYDYIPNYKGTNEYNLSREKRKNDFLTKELIKSKIDINLLDKEADMYASALLKKQKEIENLHDDIRDMEKQMFI